jgi:hypothetical protein
MSDFEQFLDLGGKFIIKNQDGKPIIACEFPLGEKEYHMGFYLPDGIEEILDGDCSRVAMREMRRLVRIGEEK